MKKLHEHIRAQIKKVSTSYKVRANKYLKPWFSIRDIWYNCSQGKRDSFQGDKISSLVVEMVPSRCLSQLEKMPQIGAIRRHKYEWYIQYG